MSKLSEIFKNLQGKWENISRGKKIALGVSFAGLIVIAIYLAVSLSSSKYEILFSDLDPTDANTVIEKLKEKKITDYKVSGNSIYVPKEMKEELRLELAPQLTSGSKGWELLDSGTSFGATDEEMKIKYQRALQGELEKTIKSFPQIERARVALVLPEDSVFVKDSTPASASITLMMKPGQSLTDEQVKAIVALVSGSVKNLPSKNVQIIDDKMTLLTKDLFNDDAANLTSSTLKQQEMKKEYEKYLEDKVAEQLSKPFNNRNITVKINADLDFDAVENVTTKVDPKGTPISEKIIEENNNGNNTTTSQSPVDNNMTNGAVNSNNNLQGSTHKEQTTNYEVSKSETKTQKAPGSIKRITASVIINGNIDDSLKNQVTSIVAGAIGFDGQRGDSINVEGIVFDDTDSQNAKKALDEMKAQEEEEKKKQLYKYIAAGAGLFLLSILFIVLMRKGKKKNSEFDSLGNNISPKGIDVVVGDKNQMPQNQYKPIDLDLDDNNEKLHLEKEIKKYASEKPDQVVDIIKSWLAEDER
ncbi:flagellar basal-body MS-ring/collar protein FliF [Clostridium prolinivorans]|uniref:flagellar basal-body MS-ring/collar protein FliF n=1 Tax=Clostridium prolinivorans TaxID=2769420 RepID=UPI000FD85733|nr:flagellar basal-body MS-ring/collar protein FliF [Clostridium prolinivorans]